MVLQIGDAGRPVGAAGGTFAAAGNGERKVVAALLDADEAASDEIRRDAGRGTARERIEDQVALAARGENCPHDERKRLLRRMLAARLLPRRDRRHPPHVRHLPPASQPVHQVVVEVVRNLLPLPRPEKPMRPRKMKNHIL